MATPDEIAKLVDLTKDIKIAMLTTVEEDGAFAARPMAQQEVQADGSLYFFTERDSNIVRNIAANPHVGVALSSASVWVSIAGTANGTALAPSPSVIAIGIGASICAASYSLLMVLSRTTAQPAVFTTSTLRPCLE